MLLRYPITSYASHYVDLTGGYMSRFEDYIIEKVSAWMREHKTRTTLNIMSDRELADLGLSRADIGIVAKGEFEAGHEQRRS